MTDPTKHLDEKALEAAARAVGVAVCKAYADDAIWAEDVEWQKRRVDSGAPFNTARAAITAYLSAAQPQGGADELAGALDDLLDVVHGSWFADDGTDSADEVETVKRARAALTRHRANAGDADGWLPIETAPKDGMRVLLWMKQINDARFRPTEEDHVGIGSWVVWSDAMKREGMKDGWSFYGSALHYPTHWRPLPDPPAIAAMQER